MDYQKIYEDLQSEMESDKQEMAVLNDKITRVSKELGINPDEKEIAAKLKELTDKKAKTEAELNGLLDSLKELETADVETGENGNDF